MESIKSLTIGHPKEPGTGFLSKKSIVTPLVLPLLLAYLTFASFGVVRAQNIFARVSTSTTSTIYIYDAANGTQSTFASALPFGAGMACDSMGDLFLADPNNGKISEVTPAGVQSTFASGLGFPVRLACDSANDLFVSCQGGVNNAGPDSIIKITPNGVQSTFYSGSGLDAPSGLAFDSTGNLYEADLFNNGTIYVYPPGGSQAVFVSGFLQPGTTYDQFVLAFDSTGDLFMADVAYGIIYEFAKNEGNGTLSTTPATFYSGLSNPNGLSFDSAGDLFEADDGTGNINEFVNNAGTLSTTPMTFASAANLHGLVFQSVPSPVPYGYETFLSFDPEYPSSNIPFYDGPAYSQTSDSIYATAGNDNNGYSIYTGGAFSYGITSDLNPDAVYTFLDDPGNYAYTLSYNPDPTPAVGSDGTTYVVTPSGILYALNPDGSEKWIYYGINLAGGNVYASPSIGLDGNIYMPTDDGAEISTLFCIDPDLGLPKWELHFNNPETGDMDASPVSTPTGIYGEDEGNELHYITYYGQETNYVSLTSTRPGSSPAITPQGFLCIGDSYGNLDIVNTNPPAQPGGSVLWSCQLDNSPISASPVVGPDGNVYVGTSAGNFFAVQLPADETQTAPKIIAELSLNSSLPTTAAVGADSRVYVGTSFNEGGPGSLYSMHLKAVCGLTYPDEFVIDWQTTVADGGFFGSPLIAQVGSSHNNNVVYDANENGSVYAFFASAGPSTTTWSTFKGNDQRQGNWDNDNQSIPPRPELWSVQFGSPTSQLSQSGKAAYGNSSADFWNQEAVPINNSSFPMYDYTGNRNNNTLTVTTSPSTGLYGQDVAQDDHPFNDNLMAHYMYSQNPFTVTISGLPTQGFNNGPALYDVYVYAYGGQDTVTYYNSDISINPPDGPYGTDPVSPQSEIQKTSCQQSLDGFVQPAQPENLSLFTQNYQNPNNDYENGEYVVFHNVPATPNGSSGGVITITAQADSGNQGSFPLINGIQIVAKQ
jgi:outer membrane protein assembly factor BamB